VLQVLFDLRIDGAAPCGNPARAPIHDMIARILTAQLIWITGLPLAAETRAWRSVDGTRSIEARFVKRDESSVTLLRADRREVVIPLDKIHPDDREWLNGRHPLSAAGPEPAGPATGVFDTLMFGDSRARVQEKLMASLVVESTMPATLLARTGLNRVFRTRGKTGGHHALLDFDWCENGGLIEVMLRTEPVGGEETDADLEACWKAYIELLGSQHGQALQAIGKLDLASIPDATMSATHLWKLEPVGSVLLGALRDGDRCHIAVRYTTEDIEPVIIPAPEPPAPRDPER
jgi:hypothetical protein